MRYAVFGAAGQLGQDLCKRLEGEVIALGRQHADLEHARTLQPLLESLRPDVVVNCAAYNFVDKAEAEPALAFAVNALGPRMLAQACERLDCTLVHFSSDHVFGMNESRRTPYREDDEPGPVSVYGSSKLAGEYFVRALCSKHFVIRTCGLYGAHGGGGKGTNFVETMLRLADNGSAIRVVSDQTCTPTCTADLAEAAIKLIKTNAYGLYHVTNAGSCTWHEFASTVFDLARKPVNVAAVSSRDYGATARRPTYSVLATDKCKSLSITLQSWQEALAEYLRVRSLR